MFFDKITEITYEHIIRSGKNNTDGSVPKILLGLSGGPDSVFLLHVLQRLAGVKKIELWAAHLDHEWRPESSQDTLFCQELCDRIGVKFIAQQASNLNLDYKFNGSQEELGRKMRRLFFETLVQEHNFDFIALAHHLQDQQETFFIRLVRGTTLSGLTCMKPIDSLYLRPLLSINKQDMLDYLDHNNIAYLQDPTNTSDDYLRNRIRKTIIPALTLCDERFNQKFETTLHALQEENEFLERLTQKTFCEIFVLNPETQKLMGNLRLFRSLDPVMQKRVLLQFLIQVLTQEKVSFSPSSGYIQEILRFLMSERGGSHHLGTTWKLSKQQQTFWIEKL